jgi:hypothetical protein
VDGGLRGLGVQAKCVEEGKSDGEAREALELSLRKGVD